MIYYSLISVQELIGPDLLNKWDCTNVYAPPPSHPKSCKLKTAGWRGAHKLGSAVGFLRPESSENNNIWIFSSIHFSCICIAANHSKCYLKSPYKVRSQPNIIIERNPRALTMSKRLVTVGRQNFLLTGRSLRQTWDQVVVLTRSVQRRKRGRERWRKKKKRETTKHLLKLFLLLKIFLLLTRLLELWNYNFKPISWV